MRIGFLNNQLDNRGTGNALLDYATFAEDLLGHRSEIYTFHDGWSDPGMEGKLISRFGEVKRIRAGRLPDPPDVLYHITSGEDTGIRFPDTRYAVHAVFDGSTPHGDRFATISHWMGERFHIPYVPHILRLAAPIGDLRAELGIPPDAVVIGRHGGADSFDIPWVWKAMRRVLRTRRDVWFLLLNTKRPRFLWLGDPRRVVFLPGTADDGRKAAFIEACDVMLHARRRGETFGIACGEFSLAGRPVLTFAGSPERAHLEHLAEHAVPYENHRELADLIVDEAWRGREGQSAYAAFTPEKVMATFDEVFLA